MSESTAKTQVIGPDSPAPDAPSIDGKETPPAPQEEPRDLEKRLSTIIGVTNDLRQSDTNRNTELADLKALVVGMNQQLEALGNAKATSAPPANPPVDPFSAPATVDPSVPNSQVFQESINSAVEKALKPMLDQDAEKSARLTKHQASYAKVVERDPAFLDPSSEEKKYFDQVYNSRPDIQVLEDAPAVVAEMVRGIMADDRIEAVRQDLAKSRTALPDSAGRPTPQGDPEKVREAFKQLQAKGEKIELTVAERGDYLNLATAVAHLDADSNP